MQELRLALMGSPRIAVDGEEKVLRERKAIALLAWLAVERTPQRRDTLATLFWPEHDQQRARANLRYLLWVLRKELGEALLTAEGDQIALGEAVEVQVDVAEFRRHLDEWRGHTHPADDFCADCLASLEAAAQLYRGDFLQGFSLDDSPQFDDWQFFQAEELRRGLAEALEALVVQEIARQDYEAAIGHARRRLALDPLHEPAHRALMKLYAWADQYEAAIRQFHRCALALQDEIGVEPDAETSELYAEIRNRRFARPAPAEASTLPHSAPPSATPSPPVGNLPSASTLFVGRQEELAHIAERLADPSTRLLTIVGPGGMGKSSLALHAGRAAAGNFPNGVWFVTLAGMESPEQLPAAILNALEAPSEGSVSPRQQLLRYLRGKHSLLILDNFEDVLPAAEFVGELLHTCLQVNLLVTSRERLNLREEWLLALGSLDYPTAGQNDSNGAVLAHYSALQLFELCAQRLQPGFALDQTSLPPVIRICQLVEGMPLALEMAAAWVRLLPLAQIPGEIAESLDFLSTSARNVEARHHSIHAVFDHSWQLLTQRERSVLRQLSVFRHSFSREGAEVVTGASLLELSSLLDKSWIRLIKDGRYQMHALAQQYALEKLQSGTEEPIGDVLQRHCLFYADFVPSEGRFCLDSGMIPATEIENIKLAWQTALEQGYWDVLGQIAIAVYQMTDIWGNLGIKENLERTVDRLEADLQLIPATDDPQREAIETALIRFLQIAGDYQTHMGDVRQGIAHLSKGRALLDLHRDSSRLAANAYANITSTLGFAYYYSGQFANAERHYREAMTVFGALGESHKGAVAHLYLLMVYIRLGRYPEAEELIRTTEFRPDSVANWSSNQALQRSIGWLLTRQGHYNEARSVLEESWKATPPRYHSHTLLYLGPVVRGQGNGTEALEILQRGLVIAEEVGDRPAQADILTEMGFTALQLGTPEIAQDYFSRSYAVAEAIGRRHTVSRALLGLGRAALQQEQTANARDYLTQALTVAAEVNAPPDLLEVLVGVAALYAAEGKGELAVELLTLAAEHPATTHETRVRAQELLRSLGQEGVRPEAALKMDEVLMRLEQAVQVTQTLLQR